MSFTIRSASPLDATAISRLVHDSFMGLAAADWHEAAVAVFLEESRPDALAATIASSFLACTAYADEDAVGFALMPRASLLGMLFVAPRHLRQGVARQLWEHARSAVEARAPDVRTVELNATPFALPAYRALGFYPISEAFERRGSVATRMACWLPGRALARRAREDDDGAGDAGPTSSAA